ncbi:MAG TPA: hypothetical protein VEB22_04520 [Phycisphaerales bacterium]|nr:hypothetical protein [Phycisphaerales bacterium]
MTQDSRLSTSASRRHLHAGDLRTLRPRRGREPHLEDAAGGADLLAALRVTVYEAVSASAGMVASVNFFSPTRPMLVNAPPLIERRTFQTTPLTGAWHRPRGWPPPCHRPAGDGVGKQ